MLLTNTMEWRRVDINENYWISERGDIFSVKTMKILKPFLSGNYLSFNIGGKIKTVHRLVAENFIWNPDSKKQVDHIDSDKRNNNRSNLRWVTASENKLKSFRIEGHKKRNRPIAFTNDREILIYLSYKEAALDLSVHSGSIYSALNRGYKVKGYELERLH